MTTFKDHCLYCLEHLGAEFRQVHLWLDEFCGQPPYGTRHRHLRHHLEGVEQVRAMWGHQAANAAELHIRQDLETEGFPESEGIPADSKQYLKTGLW